MPIGYGAETGANEKVIAELMAIHTKSAGVLPRLEEEYATVPRPPRREASASPGPSRNADLVLRSVAGRVGQDPEWRQAGESDVIQFSIALTTGYGDDAPPPTWIQCTAWDRKPELQDFIDTEIRKGDPVAVEGTYKTNEKDGKVYHQINIVRLGTVDWFQASAPKSESAPRGRRTEVEAPAAAEAPAEDALPF